jgi:prepilin-type N-terminal cleavage/methylation domain-containing protein
MPDLTAQRGFSLVEVLAALLIVSFVAATSIAVFFEREKRLAAAEAAILVAQALANEAETVRNTPYGMLEAGTAPFQSDLEIVSRLADVSGSRTTDQWRAGVKRVTLTMEWGGGSKSSTLVVLRSDTGGGPLW